jgi:hypothetical protein
VGFFENFVRNLPPREAGPNGRISNSITSIYRYFIWRQIKFHVTET